MAHKGVVQVMSRHKPDTLVSIENAKELDASGARPALVAAAIIHAILNRVDE